MALNKSAGFFWDDSNGPLENLFNLVEMGSMVVAPGPAKVIILLSNLFGVGLGEIGKFLDETLDLDDLESIEKMDPREAATKVTTDLFDISEDALAKHSFDYLFNMKKFARIEAELLSTPPLAIHKEALIGSILKKIFKRKAKSKGKGFIGGFFSSILGLFSWAWKMLKMALVGGVGVLALKATDIGKSDDDKDNQRTKYREEDSDKWDDLSRGLVDISTKETANPYKIQLENRIEDILGS